MSASKAQAEIFLIHLPPKINIKFFTYNSAVTHFYENNETGGEETMPGIRRALIKMRERQHLRTFL